MNLKEKYFYSITLLLLLGAFISPAFIALGHIFLVILVALNYNSIIPVLFTQFKHYSKSNVFLILFCIAIVLSLLINFVPSHNFMNSIMKVKYFVIPIILILLFRNIQISAEKSKLLLYILIGLVTICGVVGILKNISPNSPDQWYLIRNAGFSGITSFSHNLSLAIVLLISTFMNCRKRLRLRNLSIFAFLILINVLLLYTTYTRGAQFSLIGSVFLIFLLQLNLRFFILVCSVSIVCLSVLLTTSSFFEKLVKDEKNSLAIRLDLAEFSFWQFKESPVFGNGYKQFKYLIKKNQKESGVQEVPEYCTGHAHNLYLEIMVSTGILGITFFLLWFIFWGLELRKKPNFKIYIPCLLCIALSGLTHNNLGDAECTSFIMILYVITSMNQSKKLALNS